MVHEACAQLWAERQDFELLATADPQVKWTRSLAISVGLPQRDLPGVMREADILVFPTVAEEAGAGRRSRRWARQNLSSPAGSGACSLLLSMRRQAAFRARQR